MTRHDHLLKEIPLCNGTSFDVLHLCRDASVRHESPKMRHAEGAAPFPAAGHPHGPARFSLSHATEHGAPGACHARISLGAPFLLW